MQNNQQTCEDDSFDTEMKTFEEKSPTTASNFEKRYYASRNREEDDEPLLAYPRLPIVKFNMRKHINTHLLLLDSAISGLCQECTGNPRLIPFLHAVYELGKELRKELKKVLKNTPLASNIKNPRALQITSATLTLLQSMRDPMNYTEVRYKQLFEKYEEDCTSGSEVGHFLRGVVTVIFAGIGAFFGATIGTTIGWAVGSWSGPGAAVTAVLGLAKGSITGAAIGLATGTAVTGVAAGAISHHLFFSKSRRLSNKVGAVAEAGRNSLEQKPIRLK